MPKRVGARCALPCLNTNKSNKPHRIQTNHYKAAFALTANIGALLAGDAFNRTVAITLTFSDRSITKSEVNRRWKSLRTGILDRRYVRWACVIGFHRDKRLHFHVLALGEKDIRSGFNFAERHARKKPSANAALRAEWRFWRKRAVRYGFGRVQAMPVRTSIGIAKYLAGHVLRRSPNHVGCRMARYSRGWRPHSTHFSFVLGAGQEWRAAVAAFFFPLTPDDVRRIFGSKWPWLFREAIMAYQGKPKAVGSI